MNAALLLLADGRLPAGGHAHSGGVEAAVASGGVRDLATLDRYLRGRLTTVGRVEAAIAAAAHASAAAGYSLAPLDREAAARAASPALRGASRAQGRGLLRVGRRAWPHAVLDALGAEAPDGPMWPVALGAVSMAAGLGAGDAALAAADASVTGPAWAAVRLLGLDPYGVFTVLSRLVADVDREAARAAPWGEPGRAVAELPALGGPLGEIEAEDHAAWEVRLFAS